MSEKRTLPARAVSEQPARRRPPRLRTTLQKWDEQHGTTDARQTAA
ncbi:hypothetical protein [Streptomyces sp. NBC_01237]|nr:hypothetical protein [Streptomyces sp. NBC_01237]WRZ76558.1 hypothetical protein OG251_35835 [Streptomyces sp. NBC_01237]